MIYKVIEEVEIEGEVRAIDAEIELTEEIAAPFVEAGQIEAVEPAEEAEPVQDNPLA